MNMKSTIVFIFISMTLHSCYGVTLQGSQSLGVELKGVPTDLTCSIEGNLTDASAQRIWLRDGVVIAINDIIMGSQIQRLAIINSNSAMTLRIDPVQLSDAGEYICQLGGPGYMLQQQVQLSVNKLPTTEYSMEGNEVVEGTTVHLASCSAKSSKPAPTIWYEDGDGNKVSTDVEVEVTDSTVDETASYNLPLISTFNRKDHNKELFCKIQHENADDVEAISLGPLDVKFSPTVQLAESGVAGQQLIKMEGEDLAVNCIATGNPAPTVLWQFTANVVNASLLDTVLPGNFFTNDRSDGYVKTLATNSLLFDTGYNSNNGTYTCIASNGIGQAAQVSFDVGVYEIPTTTPAPTTQVATTEFEMLVVGADTAVIAGVIAVAAFVLIVTIVLLMRYFMSHKGEYYTNELKVNDVEDDDDDLDDLPVTEADLLGPKKKTEHFL